MSKIESLIGQKRWREARAMIQEELISAPTSHWLWTTLGLTYYEQKKYKKALECSKRAVELQPDCPLVLWDYAGTLLMNGRSEAALAIWTLLLEMDMEQVAYGECSEGMDWALQLINDVHYRVGSYHLWKGQEEQARISFDKYLHNRKHGVGSIYDKREVQERLGRLASANHNQSAKGRKRKTRVG